MVQPGKTHSRVLVLSTHTGQVDRRIIAQMNTLAQTGRCLTLVSLRAEIAPGSLDPSVRVIMPGVSPGPPPLTWPQRLGRLLPPPLYGIARSVWRCRPWRRPVPSTDVLVALTPPGSFDVVHCHDLDTLPSAVDLRRARLPCARIIYDSHEFFPFQFHERAAQEYWSSVERRHIGEADAIITVNDLIAQEMSRRYGVAAPVVIYNSYGVTSDSSPCTPQEFLDHFGAPPGGARVLFQGSLTEGRNLETMVRGVAELGPGVRLFMLGGGGEEDRLRRLCQHNGHTNVHFGPWVPQHQLLSLTRLADLGIIPYLGDRLLNNRLCTPNKLFEYIEAGVPICASDLPELRRIVRGDGIGDVYPMETPEQVKEAVADCLRRAGAGEFRARLPVAAETYSWRRQAQVLLSVYERLGV
jgi:glycosyltransferase involved in cell wall biosynthesis